MASSDHCRRMWNRRSVAGTIDAILDCIDDLAEAIGITVSVATDPIAIGAVQDSEVAPDNAPVSTDPGDYTLLFDNKMI